MPIPFPYSLGPPDFFHSSYVVPLGINREAVRLSPIAWKIWAIDVKLALPPDAAHPPVLSEKNVLMFEAIAPIALHGCPE